MFKYFVIVYTVYKQIYIVYQLNLIKFKLQK